jgi:hypothetical protein
MSKKQSLAGVIRERLTTIESRLEFGIRQEVLISELKEEGFETTLATFRNALLRARQWREKKQENSAPSQIGKSYIEENKINQEQVNNQAVKNDAIEQSKNVLDPNEELAKKLAASKARLEASLGKSPQQLISEANKR